MLFEINTRNNALTPVPALPFDGIPFREAKLNEMVRSQLSALVREPLLVIASEVTRRQDPGTRIDIVALDKQARPIAIELKLQERGHHGELQALRGGGVLADLTVEELCIMHGKTLEALYAGGADDSTGAIEQFLGRLPTTLGQPRMLVITNGASPRMWRTVTFMQANKIQIGMVDLAARRVGGKLFLDVTHLLCASDDTPRQTTINELRETFPDLTWKEQREVCPDEAGARTMQQAQPLPMPSGAPSLREIINAPLAGWPPVQPLSSGLIPVPAVR